MKNLMKRIVPLVLVLVMCVCVAAPAFASTSEARISTGTINLSGITVYAYGESSKHSVGACASGSSITVMLHIDDDWSWKSRIYNSSTVVSTLGASSGLSASYNITSAGTYYVTVKNPYNFTIRTANNSYATYFKM